MKTKNVGTTKMAMTLSTIDKQPDLKAIKAFLDEWVPKINVPSFIERDPIQFVHRYTNREDQEVVAILTATITWGNRAMILNSATKMLKMMGDSPFDFIRDGAFHHLSKGNIHRTFFVKDLLYLCRGLQQCYQTHHSIEDYFVDSNSIWAGLTHFRKDLAVANEGVYSKHVSNPESNSACKRLHLALRWLVRNDGVVDLGLWDRISPSALYIPLDVHVGRIARSLGLLHRSQNDAKSVEHLTHILRSFSPEDPIKYDFALFGIGESKNALPQFGFLQ